MVIIENKILSKDNERLYETKQDAYLALQEARTDVDFAETKSEKQQANKALDLARKEFQDADAKFCDALAAA